MKGLTIEQKAKAYDEALKVLHKYDGANIMFTQDLKEEMFPELKEEYEDERTKKEIVRFIQMEVEDEIVGNKWLAWLEKQGEQTPSQINEKALLHLVSDVLTWQNGIGQYLDDPRVQELAKKLCSEYTQKLYNPSVLSNSSNIEKNEQKSASEIEPRFKVDDWIVYNDAVWKVYDISLQNYYELLKINNEVSTRLIKDVDENAHLWDITDAKEGDVLAVGWWKDKDFWQKL